MISNVNNFLSFVKLFFGRTNCTKPTRCLKSPAVLKWKAMKREGKRRNAAQKMPFKVDRKLGVDIATQVTDGIREAILTGFYKPGDILPKVLEFTHGLHVSLRAPLAAYRALKREGLISPRRGLGTVVVGPKADVFHGRVVIVRPYDNPYYYNAAVEAGLLRRLSAAGYAVAIVSALPLGGNDEAAGKGRFDERQLAAALSQNTSLAIILSSVPAIERAVAATGTPYFVLGVNKPATDGCVGSAPIDIDSALPGVLARLRERNVRSLVQMGIRQMDLMDSDALRGACKSYEELAGWPKHVKRVTQEDIVRAAYDFFCGRYQSKADLPDAFLFTDDYLARGALLALLAAGIRTGRDVLVITFANKGTTPLHPDPVDFVLSDPARNADVVADALVAYLQSGVAPGTIALENAFVAGER